MSSSYQPAIEPDAVIDTLNGLMRAELAAAETYRHALARLGDAAPDDLRTCLESHDRRATRLAEHISLSGGTPVSGSALWGAVAHMMESGAALIAARSLFAALMEGEDQSVRDYRAALDHVNAPAAELLRNHLLPEQLGTHSLMRSLYHRGAAGA